MTVSLGGGLPLYVADGVADGLGELPAWVPTANGHLTFGLVDELAGRAFAQPHGQGCEHVQDAADRFAGLVEADPDEIPARQRRPGDIGGDAEAASTVERPQARNAFALQPFGRIDPIG